MQEQYLVSVIIPAYNTEKYLKNILEDITNQSYRHLQIIIINDGSIDGTEKLAKDYEKRDKRIEVYSFENGGQSKARNRGIEVARGEFIRFIDSDDRVPLDSIEKMVRAMNMTDEVDMVIGNFESNSQYGIYRGNNLENQIVLDNQFAEMLIKAPRAFYYGAPWNKLYKTNIIKKAKIQFDDTISWCEDLLFNIEYYKECKKISVLNCENGVYKYFIRETGVTGRIKQDKEEEAEIEKLRYEKLFEFFKKYNMQSDFQLGWKYINFYYRLTNCVKKENGKKLSERYKAFSDMLKAKDAYHFICMRECDYDPRVVRMLKRAIEKNHIFRVFMFFLIKSWMAVHFGKIMKGLRNKIGLKIPTDY